MRKTWICPECQAPNEYSVISCVCGYELSVEELEAELKKEIGQYQHKKPLLDVGDIGYWKMSELMVAAHNGQFKTLKRLLSKKQSDSAYINAHDIYGRTALMY